MRGSVAAPRPFVSHNRRQPFTDACPCQRVAAFVPMCIAKRVRVRVRDKRREQIETRRLLLRTEGLQPLLWIGQIQLRFGTIGGRQGIGQNLRIDLKFVRDEHESHGHLARPAITNDLCQGLERPLPLVFERR